MKSIESLLSQSAIISAGDFVMGARNNDTNASRYEFPSRNVFLDQFRMAKTTVTNAQFAEFVSATSYQTHAERVRLERNGSVLNWRSFSEKDDHPVVMVSHADAVAYLDWLNTSYDLGEFTSFRLPTEAEWEKAARGGLAQALYPWGNEEPKKGERMVWARSEADQDESLGTMPVGCFDANGYGLFDMVGNVWQWCSDWYGDMYYAECFAHNPAGPETGQYKVRRGAGWNIGNTFRARCSNRGCLYPEQVEINVGFRWVLS